MIEQTMRERLTALVETGVLHGHPYGEIVDAILSVLAEPDEGMVRAMRSELILYLGHTIAKADRHASAAFTAAINKAREAK